jgi:hypothetical protein
MSSCVRYYRMIRAIPCGLAVRTCFDLERRGRILPPWLTEPKLLTTLTLIQPAFKEAVRDVGASSVESDALHRGGAQGDPKKDCRFGTQVYGICLNCRGFSNGCDADRMRQPFAIKASRHRTTAARVWCPGCSGQDDDVWTNRSSFL